METTTTDFRTDIRSANEQFEAAFARGDADVIANLYTDKGMLLPAGSDTIQGKTAIRDFWKGAMNMGVKQVKLDSAEVESLGDTVIERGTYTLSGEAAQPLDQGKYIVIWKKQNDRWKLEKDIWNTSLAPQ